MSKVKGVYVLVISAEQDIKINVGSLGEMAFEKGLYVYVGSAQKNLEKRIKRHLRKNKQKFWHIDYLLNANNVNIARIFHNEADKATECRIAASISLKGIPVKRFGSSDCKCISHLFKLREYQFLTESMREINIWNIGG